MRFPKATLLAGSALLVGSALAFAQAIPGLHGGVAYDPAQLPSYKGQIQTFTLTPRGDIDGFVLADGTEIKTPPHLSTQLAFMMKPGSAVTVHGLKAASLPLVQGVSVTDDASGKTVVDNGPPGPGREPPPPPPPPTGSVAATPTDSTAAASQPAAPGSAEAQGKVRMALHGARGEVNGVLMEDGTILRLPPPEALRFATLLQAGQTVVAEGESIQSPIAKVIAVTQIGQSRDQLSPVQDAPPHGKRGRRGPPPA